MKIDDIRQGFGSLIDSVSEGWHRLRESTTGALTRFKPGTGANLPERHEMDDDVHLGGLGWAMIGGDVYEDERSVLVRLEVPGMHKQDFQIEVLGTTLTVRGEKRFERERSEGRWRVMQCAYGHFQRRVPLPAAVRSDEARATYRDGVLRIELPKAEVAQPRTVHITPA